MLVHQPGDVLVVRGKSYQLQQLMGRGGQGSVFEARNGEGGRVAIKMVPAHDRHLTEIKILASLKSEHVVKLFDAGVTARTLIMIMERIDGVDLKDLIQLCRDDERQVPPSVALQIIRQAAIGLQDATASGKLTVHRDIKPGNLIFSRQGVVKLIDFGIAQRHNTNDTGSLVGTPENMAPEQVGLEKDWKVDVRTDLYCLGLVLFELLTLETLFRFPSTMPIPERLLIVSAGDVRERLRVIEHSHPQLYPLLVKALQRNPAHRFQSPNDMVKAIDHVLGTLGPMQPLLPLAEALYKVIQLREPTRLTGVLPARRPAETLSLELPRQSAPAPAAPRFPVARLAAVAAAVIAIAVLAGWFLTHSSADGTLREAQRDGHVASREAESGPPSPLNLR